MEDLHFKLAVPTKGWTQGCAFCGIVVADGQKGTEIETKWADLGGTSFLFRRVWHLQCYLENLDEGEES